MSDWLMKYLHREESRIYRVSTVILNFHDLNPLPKFLTQPEDGITTEITPTSQ